MKLIATTIRDLTAVPAAFDKVYFDERLPGFGLRVRKSGSHTWMIKYTFGGQVRRMVLGPLRALDPGKAFDTAKDLLARFASGAILPPRKRELMSRPARLSAHSYPASWSASGRGSSRGVTRRPSAISWPTPRCCMDSQ